MSRIGAHVIEIEELESLKDINDLTIPLPDYEKWLNSQEMTTKEKNETLYSNCCGVEMDGQYLDMLMCPECKDHCGVEKENEQ